ncbi:type IV secretory system conjugative DNA transfer family protein [Rhodococcus erythropolis]
MTLPDTPYAGWISIDTPGSTITHDERNEGLRNGDRAQGPVHLLVTGETGGGKTRRVLGPNILAWGPRPVVAMSSKGDMAELTIAKRAARGPVYLLDLSQEVRESQLQGMPVTAVSSDPCAAINTDDEALGMADLLMETGAIGSGDTGGGGDAAFWKALARRRLACFLRAGGWYPDPEQDGELVWGGGIAWALNACETVGPDAAEDTGGTHVVVEGLDEEAAEELDDPETPADLLTPNWSTTYLRVLLQGSRHAGSLLAAREMDQRQRDSIGINCQVAMSAWAQDQVATGLQPFHPRMLEQPGATLYMVSPSTGAGATPAALTLVQIVNHWRKRVGRLDPILFVLDELTNGSPIPAKRFLGWVGEGRSLGIRICAAVQNTDQFALIWSEAALRVLRNIMPGILVLKGANEVELLERAVKTARSEEVVTASLDASGSASHSRQRAGGVDLADLTPQRTGEGRLLLSGMQGVRVSLPDVASLGLVDAA